MHACDVRRELPLQQLSRSTPGVPTSNNNSNNNNNTQHCVVEQWTCVRNFCSMVHARHCLQACEALAAAAAAFAEHASRADQQQRLPPTPQHHQQWPHQQPQDLGAGAYALLKQAHTRFAQATRHAYAVLGAHASAAAASPVLDYCAGFADAPAT
eukprot:scaffold56200_cov19-Tisochrysis_lutea.AAC.2